MPMNYGGYGKMPMKHNDAGPGSAVTGKPRKLGGMSYKDKPMKMKSYKKTKSSKPMAY